MLCLEKKSNAVILDCGHANICFLCAFKLYRTQQLCHLCRQPIKKVIKVQQVEGLNYQKVLGVVQKVENRFYYSDITKETNQAFKSTHMAIDFNQKSVNVVHLIPDQADEDFIVDTECFDEGV